MSFRPVTKQQWIDALRFGGFNQCTGALGRLDPDTGARSYCCLGVLATIAGVGHRRHTPVDPTLVFDFDDNNWESGIIPEAFRSIIVSDLDLGPQDELMRILTTKNDNGTSFNDIADYLETVQ